MSYTIDTVENTNIVLKRYLRRSIAATPMELTDRPVLTAPAHLATGVSVTPEINWEEYVKAVPVENQVYKLEVVEIATTGTTPDWTSPFVRVTDQTNISLREVLDPSKVYSWRVLALSRTLPESFTDVFERAELGADYESELLQGNGGGSSIYLSGLRVGADGTSQTSRQVTKLRKIFENPTIHLKGVQFTDVTSGSQPTIYFNTEGDFVNNQQNGYYLFFFEDTLRLGKVVDNNPSDLKQVTFERAEDTKYDIKIQSVNGHNRIKIWLSSEDEPFQQIDDTDDDPYTAGGVSFVQVSLDTLGGYSYMRVDDIEVIYAQGVATVISSVTVTGSTSNLTEGSTRQFQFEVEGSGNVQQSVDWEVNIGSIDENGLYTADGGTGTIIPKAISTQDPNVEGTTQFDVVEVPTSGYLNDTAGDESALETMAMNMSGLDSSWDGAISLSNSPNGVTVESIDGSLRVTEIDLLSLGLTGSVSNNVNNLQMMEYYRIFDNHLDGELPVFNLPSIIYLYLNFSGNKFPMDPHDQDQDGGQDVHNGKRDSNADNKFTGDLAIENAPNLEWLACCWTELDWVQDNVFDCSALKGLWLSYAQGMAGKAKEVPSTIGNMTGLRHLGMTCTETGNEFQNQWGGVLPASMSNLTDLKAVRFARNKSFTGAFPDLSGATNMRVVQLSFTRFTSGWPGYFLRDDNPYPLQTFAASWCDNSWTDAFLPDPVLSNMKSQNLGSVGLAGNITATQLPRQVAVHEMSSNNITSTDEDFTRLINIRNFRWADNNISGNLPKLDWLAPYDKLRKFSRVTFDGNNYTSSDWDMLDDGREYDISSNKVQSSSDSNPIVQKTRREWYEYHCDPNGPLSGVDGKAQQFKI